MAGGKSNIIYILTDEAPLLATYSLLPIIEKFTNLLALKSLKPIFRCRDILAEILRLPDSQNK